MPWRTLIEAANHLQKNSDFQVSILSAETGNTGGKRMAGEVPVITVPKPGRQKQIFPSHGPADLLICPVTWRTRNSSLKFTGEFKGRKIAYFPGGVYSIDNILRALGTVPVKTLLPYIADSVTPHDRIAGLLKKYGFSHVITFSEFTREHVIKGGWPAKDVTTILPGYDPSGNLEEDLHWFSEFGLSGRKYLLFMGSPTPIRGSGILLKALDKFASTRPDAQLVCLLRADPGVEKTQFDQTLARLVHADKIRVFWGKMTPAELKPFIRNSRAVALPFLVVPSEIPVTFFEVLEMGVPVITFENGGTSRYIAPGSVTCKPLSVKSLATGMRLLWDSDRIHDEKSANAVNLIKSHPTWQQMNAQWETTIRKCTSS